MSGNNTKWKGGVPVSEVMEKLIDFEILDFELPVLTEQQERELHAEMRTGGKQFVTLQTEQRPSVME